MGHTDETPQQLFVRALKIEPKWAAVLVAKELTTLEEVAYIPIDEFRAIEGLDEQQIQAWRAQAQNYLLIQEIGREDDLDPLAVATEKPPKPLSDGSGATIDDREDQ